MSFIQEFKAFAMRGNVVDLAVAVVIGGAFGKIVDSLVKDGAFRNSMVAFTLIALAIFVAVKAINRLQRAEAAAPAAPPPTPEDIILLREIRDSLKK